MIRTESCDCDSSYGVGFEPHPVVSLLLLKGNRSFLLFLYLFLSFYHGSLKYPFLFFFCFHFFVLFALFPNNFGNTR